jgi:hypothetical protein
MKSDGVGAVGGHNFFWVIVFQSYDEQGRCVRTFVVNFFYRRGVEGQGRRQKPEFRSKEQGA